MKCEVLKDWFCSSIEQIDCIQCIVLCIRVLKTFLSYSKLLALVIKHVTTQNQPKAPTASQNHPQQPTHPKQEASVKFFIGVYKWNTCFPGIFESKFRMFSHTVYQKHWVWASCNLFFHSSFWAYSALLKHHTVTQISQKNLSAFQNVS